MPKQIQEPGPGRSTAAAAFDALRKEIAQRNELADQAEFLLTETPWNVAASRVILENATVGGSCGATVRVRVVALAREVLRRRRSESPSDSRPRRRSKEIDVRTAVNGSVLCVSATEVCARTGPTCRMGR